MRHLFQRLAILLIKANASLILSHNPINYLQTGDEDIEVDTDVLLQSYCSLVCLRTLLFVCFLVINSLLLLFIT